jgi:hypothetical protein
MSMLLIGLTLSLSLEVEAEDCGVVSSGSTTVLTEAPDEVLAGERASVTVELCFSPIVFVVVIAMAVSKSVKLVGDERDVIVVVCRECGKKELVWIH